MMKYPVLDNCDGNTSDGKKKKEENVLFNDTLNTFYLWLYGIGLMVKDHSDSEIGNLLLPHGLLFPISSKGSFICTMPDRIAHTTAFVKPVVEHWLERELVIGSIFETGCAHFLQIPDNITVLQWLMSACHHTNIYSTELCLVLVCIY